MDIVDKILAEDECWYECDHEAAGPEVIKIAQEIESEQSGMRAAWKRYARSYSNRDEMGLDWNLNCSSESAEAGFVTENVVKSVIDTAASIIAKNRVKCRVLTNGAAFNDQRKARRLEKFVYGEMKARKCWELGPLVFRDACIFGTGVLKVFGNKGKKKVQVERRLISDIIVDERSAIDGHPQEMYERQLYDKNVLISLYPAHEEAIIEASGKSDWAGTEIPKGMVVVLEAWRLGERHVITIETATLVNEPYKEQEFPFVFFRWDGLPLSGFYGLGLARDLHGIQTRINSLNKFIQVCQDLIAVPRVFVDMSSKVLKVQLNDKIGAIIPYRGKPPTFYTPTALNAEIYQYKEQLKASAFEFAGISQMSAQSLKPAGLESAVALREFSDIETSRFVIQSQRYETLFTDLGTKVIAIARRMYAGKKSVNMRVKFPNKNVIEQIDWADVELEDDRFELDVQPASLLSMSPSARLQAVTELAQVGQLDKAEVRYLLNHPDIEASNDIATADYKMAMKLEGQLLDGETVVPEPFYNLDLILRRTQLLYQSVQVDYDDVPDDILENIRSFISQTKSLMEQAMQAGAAQQQQADPAAAQGADPMSGGPEPTNPISLPGEL